MPKSSSPTDTQVSTETSIQCAPVYIQASVDDPHKVLLKLSEFQRFLDHWIRVSSTEDVAMKSLYLGVFDVESMRFLGEELAKRRVSLNGIKIVFNKTGTNFVDYFCEELKRNRRSLAWVSLPDTKLSLDNIEKLDGAIQKNCWLCTLELSQNDDEQADSDSAESEQNAKDTQQKNVPIDGVASIAEAADLLDDDFVFVPSSVSNLRELLMPNQTFVGIIQNLEKKIGNIRSADGILAIYEAVQSLSELTSSCQHKAKSSLIGSLAGALKGLFDHKVSWPTSLDDFISDVFRAIDAPDKQDAKQDKLMTKQTLIGRFRTFSTSSNTHASTGTKENEGPNNKPPSKRVENSNQDDKAEGTRLGFLKSH